MVCLCAGTVGGAGLVILGKVGYVDDPVGDGWQPCAWWAATEAACAIGSTLFQWLAAAARAWSMGIGWW